MHKDESALCREFCRQFQQVIDYNMINRPDSLMWYHIPNGQRSGGWALTETICKAFPMMAPHKQKLFKMISQYGGIAGRMDKLLGARKGVPDYFFSWRNADNVPFIGYLEAKIGKGELTPEQEVFFRHCQKDGIYAAEFRTVDDALKTLKSWGVISERFIL